MVQSQALAGLSGFLSWKGGTERPASFAGEFFEHLFHAAELANMTTEERRQYDLDMVTEIDKRAHLEYARQEGREEERQRIASELLSLGVSEQIIWQATKMPPEEDQVR